MMAGGACFAFTTETTPGAGTRIASTIIPAQTPSVDTTVCHIQWVTLAIGGELVSSDNPVPVTLDGETGTPFYADATEVATTPGTQQELISFAVPGLTIRRVRQVLVRCRAEGTFQVTSNGAIIGTGRTGAASPNGIMTWSPARVITGTVKVLFKARQGSAVSVVDAHLQAADEG